jgi:hypothetical protein
MSITISDPALLAQISQASGIVDVQDPDGRIIGKIHIETTSELLKRYKCPLTEEELDRRSLDHRGRPIGDVIKELKATYGE